MIIHSWKGVPFALFRVTHSSTTSVDCGGWHAAATSCNTVIYPTLHRPPSFVPTQSLPLSTSDGAAEGRKRASTQSKKIQHQRVRPSVKCIAGKQFDIDDELRDWITHTTTCPLSVLGRLFLHRVRAWEQGRPSCPKHGNYSSVRRRGGDPPAHLVDGSRVSIFISLQILECFVVLKDGQGNCL